MWHRLLEREAVERQYLEDQALLDRRRLDLESAVGATVPKTLEGPDAPTESERIAHEVTHLPPAPWSEIFVFGRGIEASHVRLTPSERDERPIIAMDFAVRNARAEDGGVDDDLGTFVAIVHSSTGSMRAISAESNRSNRLCWKLSDRLREELVCRKVPTTLR